MKIAIITGASSGIGKEFASQIASKYKKMDEIWLIARRKTVLEDISKDLKIPVRIIAMDISVESDLNDFSAMLNEVKPDIKLLVNSAGVGKTGRIDSISYEDQMNIVKVNCSGLLGITKICLPFISQNSRIINMASASAFCPQPDFAVYAASKAFVLSFSRSLHKELRNNKITVTAVCPGPVDTDFFANSGNKLSVLKRICMAKPHRVVSKAIRDAALGNDMSVYGIKMKICRFATKVLPSRFVMKFFKDKE